MVEIRKICPKGAETRIDSKVNYKKVDELVVDEFWNRTLDKIRFQFISYC